MKFCVRLTGWALLLCVMTLGSGCRYLANRYYDARDVFSVGAGITGENPRSGIIPQSLGLYVEATDWLQLGAIHTNGYVAELDQRGSFIGPESETRFGLLWWQMIQKNQSYANACFRNQFKDQDFPWCNRMESLSMRSMGVPAKRLHYEHYSNYMIRGTSLLHRGWQYWEYVGFQAAICEPFLTHAGIYMRAGFDLSEVADFLLGFTGFDFKHDDMNCDEWAIFINNPLWMGEKLVPAKPCPPAERKSTMQPKNETAPAQPAEPPAPTGEKLIVPKPAPAPMGPQVIPGT